MAERILILSAAVGSGHVRAAQAVEAALREVAPDAEVKNAEVLGLTSAVFRLVYGHTYFRLVHRAPHLAGYLYDLTDQPPTRLKFHDRVRLTLERINAGRLIRQIVRGQWDLVIHTHFLAAELIARLRRSGRIDTPQAIAVTDFQTHRYWINQPADRYFTATAEGAHNLAAWGVPADTIRVTGIPVHPRFAEPRSRADAAAALGLGGDRPIIVQMAGGFGIKPTERIFRSLLAIRRPLEIVVVAGHNRKVRANLAAIPCPPQHRCQVLGFTDQMSDLLAACDLLVSKSGGLTVAEALARGAAMVVVNPIPGQETRNCDFLLENGCAIKPSSLATLAFKIEQLLDDPARLESMRCNARRIGRPRAAYDIVNSAMELIRPAQPPARGQ
ncbi:MAG: Processive diacylglycerol beta-glucosyltransferase [Phycisphaerae bacterium]|nr:Processive diacylglycerol beta-glucosyltransferase [Phycisphaerae bacterium]